MVVRRFLYACCFPALFLVAAPGTLAQDDAAALRSLLDDFLAGVVGPRHAELGQPVELAALEAREEWRP